MDNLSFLGIDSAIPFKTENFTANEFLTRSWPVLPGSYRVFSPTCSVAIALLQDVALDDLSGIDLSGVAIAGTITTENIGVEHLVKNVIANPYIRHLVLFGSEIHGHLPGNALLCLHKNGIFSKGRIISAHGARPVLKNLTRLEIDHFRSQLSVTDLIEKMDLAFLGAHIAELNKLSLPPYESALRVDMVQARKAEPALRLKLDNTGYFVILVMHGKAQPILVEHYSNDGVLRNVIEGNDAASICATIVEMKLVSQLDHAAYLGRELAKAEVTIASKQPYVQDKAQGLQAKKFQEGS